MPGIGWVVLFVLALLSAAGYGLYHRGDMAGQVKVHRVALADSIVRGSSAVATATTQSDRAVTVAHRAASSSSVGRAALRTVLDDTSTHAPAAVVARVAAQLERDSITIAVQAAAIDTLLIERGARIRLDTLRVHELALKAPDSRGHAIPIAIGIGATAVIVVLLRVLR